MSKKKSKKFKFKILEVEYGVIRYQIKIGKKTFEDSFSAVFDPLPKIKKWLIEISEYGFRPFSFSYDNEGQFLRFSYVDSLYQTGKFIISDASEVDKIYIKGQVDKVDLLKEFYFGFLDFYNSWHYCPRHWESKSVGEEIMVILNIWNKKLALKILSNLKKKQVDDIIRAANPYFRLSLVEKSTNFELVNINFEDVNLKKQKIKLKRSKSLLPADYNKLSEKKKKKIMKNIFKNYTDRASFSGMSFGKMKSKIIEKKIVELNDKK